MLSFTIPGIQESVLPDSSEAQFEVHFELQPVVTHYDYNRMILGAETSQGNIAAACKPSHVISGEVIVLIGEPYADDARARSPLE